MITLIAAAIGAGWVLWSGPMLGGPMHARAGFDTRAECLMAAVKEAGSPDRVVGAKVVARAVITTPLGAIASIDTGSATDRTSDRFPFECWPAGHDASGVSR